MRSGGVGERGNAAALTMPWWRMTIDPNNVVPRPERIETDDSLRAERARTDEELDRLSKARDKDADEVLELARERADDVLAVAENKADAELQRVDVKVDTAARLSARASAQDIVNEERTAADDKLAAERIDLDRALMRVLALERGETDERLVTERDHSDRAVASRDDFMAIVSHDVRGILGAIAMSAELLSSTAGDDPVATRTRSEAQRIRRLTARMNRLIGDLLDVVSMESGKLAVLSTEQDATRVVVETMESFQLAAASQNIQLTSTIPPGPHLASFDHDRILQVLTNLVGNAIKFTLPGGAIAVHLIPMTDAIHFTVRDSGCGIASDKIEAMFERFSQAAQDRRGRGLGLYIARCIVEAHGGAIWAESQLGAGSAFHVTLPRTTA
jgi:signal transduction histidine kinase